jgi:hypothetical protein
MNAAESVFIGQNKVDMDMAQDKPGSGQDGA